MLPSGLRNFRGFSERLHEDAKHADLLQDKVSPVLGCMAVQVPASCTLPAAPPWPEEAAHLLAPLPTVRQANGVESTRGTFYEVRRSSIPLTLKAMLIFRSMCALPQKFCLAVLISG